MYSLITESAKANAIVLHTKNKLIYINPSANIVLIWYVGLWKDGGL
jgi:hypothetical protein